MVAARQEVMKNYQTLKNMRLQTTEITALSSVYGHSVATTNSGASRSAVTEINGLAKRRARRWAAQAQTNRVIGAL